MARKVQELLNKINRFILFCCLNEAHYFVSVCESIQTRTEFINMDIWINEFNKQAFIERTVEKFEIGRWCIWPFASWHIIDIATMTINKYFECTAWQLTIKKQTFVHLEMCLIISNIVRQWLSSLWTRENARVPLSSICDNDSRLNGMLYCLVTFICLVRQPSSIGCASRCSEKTDIIIFVQTTNRQTNDRFPNTKLIIIVISHE